MRSHPRSRAPRAAALAAIAGACLSSAAHARPDGTLFPPVIPLASLDGMIGFRINGAAESDQSGVSVSSAGDVNGDGIEDMLVGAHRANGAYGSRVGATYVVFGRDTAASGPFPATLFVSSLNGANGFQISGVGVQDSSGFSVAQAGDVNGDGIDDLVIGAPYANSPSFSNVGNSYVVFGKDTSKAGPFPATLQLALLDGSNGFRLDGSGADDHSGISVASAGDVNADGVHDVIIGARGADPGGAAGAGSTYVVFGKDTSVAGAFPATLALASLNGSNGFRLDGVAAADASGFSVASAGDVNADGVDDLVIGASGADPGGASGAGSAHVVFGKDTSVAGAFPAALALAALDGANGFRVDGAAAADASGFAVASAGDVNDDGVDDLVIGARGADPGGLSDAGSTYVVFGKDTSVAGAFPAALALAALDGANGFRLDGAAASDLSGGAVASAGDVNADGVNDLIIGALVADPGGLSSAGSTYVVFGKDTGMSGAFPAAMPLASLNGANGFRVDGVASGDQSGRSVASAGDVNADGVRDIIIGAAFADPGGLSSAGSTFIVYGRSDTPPPCEGDANGDGFVNFADLNIVLSQFGQTGPSLQGDVNHDGVVNFTDLNIVLSFFGTTC